MIFNINVFDLFNLYLFSITKFNILPLCINTETSSSPFAHYFETSLDTNDYQETSQQGHSGREERPDYSNVFPNPETHRTKGHVSENYAIDRQAGEVFRTVSKQCRLVRRRRRCRPRTSIARNFDIFDETTNFNPGDNSK